MVYMMATVNGCPKARKLAQIAHLAKRGGFAVDVGVAAESLF
jgi:hypothetical protein